jgi:hypothetical protein
MYSCEHDAIKTHGGVEVQIRAFLTSALDRASRSHGQTVQYAPKCAKALCTFVLLLDPTQPKQAAVLAGRPVCSRVLCSAGEEHRLGGQHQDRGAAVEHRPSEEGESVAPADAHIGLAANSVLGCW